jgi:hypothetical protein
MAGFSVMAMAAKTMVRVSFLVFKLLLLDYIFATYLRVITKKSVHILSMSKLINALLSDVRQLLSRYNNMWQSRTRALAVL